MDWSSCIIHFEQFNFPKYVINGEVENVKRVINDGYCDVNRKIDHDGNQELPLSIAIKSIQEENDNHFKIAQFLLNCKDPFTGAAFASGIKCFHLKRTEAGMLALSKRCKQRAIGQ